ncbi:hypothetical protein VTK26DRAFT_3270 [Humicola hyalothermophila]
MASLLPILQDILPMILPASVTVSKAADILPAHSQPTNGNGEDGSRVRIISRPAIVNQTDNLCASVLIVKPRCASSIRHHGEQETIIYVASGEGVLLSQPKGDDDPERHPLEQGDFAFVPSWTEHQLVNDSDVDFHLVIIRSGGKPIEVALKDWGGNEVKPTDHDS